jgi:hypothetical protein
VVEVEQEVVVAVEVEVEVEVQKRGERQGEGEVGGGEFEGGARGGNSLFLSFFLYFSFSNSCAYVPSSLFR